MKRSLVLVGLGLMMLLTLPSYSLAASTLHYFDCKQCHKAGMAIGAMGSNNTCLQCHANSAVWTDSTPAPAEWYDGTPNGRFNAADLNDLFGAATAALGAGTYNGQTHAWGVSDVKAEAGARAPNRANPLYAGFYSRYNASTGKVTCSRCHNPHGDAAEDILDNSTGLKTPDLLDNVTRLPGPDGIPDGDGIADVNILANPQLLIRDATNSNAPMQPDTMCRGCHVDFDKLDSLTINTHPIVVDYAAKQTARPNDLRTQAEIDTFTGGHASKVQMVNGGVSCVSCHGVHYTDSNSSTTDGLAYRGGLQSDDGELLRSDGPDRTGPDRNTAITGTAQLRSNLCQSCHKYELHGQGTDQHKIGCLECHNGHDPAGASDYMLRSASNGPVPTRFNRVNSGEQDVTFPVFNAGNSRTSWADEQQGTADGFCEACHGDCNSASMISAAVEHTALNGNQCTVCHKHNDPADTYSFNRDASAATCGQCHGFPPYVNQPGDRTSDGVDGGYGVNNTVAEGGPYDYVGSTTHEKNEEQTGHKVHAGRDIPTGTPAFGPDNTSVDDWYFVGASGIDNCKPCHGDNAGSTTGGHRISPSTRPNTFRDISFTSVATTGGMSPSYDPNSPYTCSNVYCHTNGAPYNGASRPTRVYTRVNTTPAWVGSGGNYANGGYGSIYGTGSRCAECHGNDVSTMTAGTGAQKSNSIAHLAHLGGATTLNLAKTFNCSICHFYTASSKDALAVNAMDGRDAQSGGTGGKHVNGLIDVNFDITSFNAKLATTSYTAADGSCNSYCHDVTNQTSSDVDWDNPTDMQCDSCHGGLASDTNADGGAGAISTGSHERHILTSINGPKLACAECHGAGADAGTHAGHIDGTVDMVVATDSGNFGSDSVSICKECHGYDTELAGQVGGEKLPVWGQSSTTDCATCHAGILCGADIGGQAPPHMTYARQGGHNRPSVSGNFPETGNLPANMDCTACHLSDSPLHWDGASGDFMLRTDAGFPATYSSNENNYCNNCHGASPAHPTDAASIATRSINTHQSKLCVACHNVHGDQNIQMIWRNPSDQNSHDPSVTGKFGAFTVFFTNVTNFLISNTDSYDEDDDATDGFLAGSEVNGDDLCATCHTSAAGTLHNNNDSPFPTDNKAPTGHKMGQNCFTGGCHAAHSDPTDAFKVGVGTACNDCHGFPPATGAHRNGLSATNPELYEEIHSSTSTPLLTEDRDDCAYCHTGADQYTYDLTADQAAGGARGNHAVSRANRQTVLANNVNVGFNNNSTPTDSSDDTCTTACHASSTGDGFWTDSNGLNCNACHYAALAPSGAANVTANNSEAVSATHDKHFNKNNMTCVQCHDVSDSPTFTSIRGPLPHVNLPDYSGADDDGTLIQGRANATLDEATVTRTNMSYSGGAADAGGINNTCSGTTGTGFATGCHASAGLPGAPSKPDWDVVIPATSAGCVMCHTETTSSAYNPTSGVHNNSPSGPTVTGNAHDGSFDDGNSGTADCITCHTASPTAVSANHINGTLNAGTAITVAAVAGYTQATGTCATTCHSAGTTWSYKWSTSAYASNGTECANCHGDYTNGWVAGVAPHTDVATKGNKHNNTGTLTYPCTDCHAIGSVSGYKWTSKWDPTGTNSNHGDGVITMNQTAVNTFAIDTAPNPDRAGCTTSTCHNQGGLTGDTAHTFPVASTAFSTATVAGNNPDVQCSGCHGGYAPGGTDKLGYWPDGVGGEDDAGAHQKHIYELASRVMGQTLTQLLNDNVGVGYAPWDTASSDAKQKELCSYCHDTPGSDVDHAVTLPAEVNSMFGMWAKVVDNGFYDNSADTCATVDCHFNKTTPDNTYGWYDGNTSGCIMCHVNVTDGSTPNSNGGTHVAHTSASTNFGRNITCDDCHRTATETVAWGAPGTPPTNNHIDGTFTIASNLVAFSYTAGQGCGTNVCHNAGDGTTAPASGATSYPWGTALADCTICHAAVPTVTAAHTRHLANTNYVPNSCDECHDAANISSHIDAKIDFGGAVTAPADDSTFNGSCTNNCHLASDAGDWTGGVAAVNCTDCHSSTYVGGNNWRGNGLNRMPQYSMHLLTPTVSGVVHDATVPGAGGNCAFCHDSLPAPGGSHIDGTWHTDSNDNAGGGQTRGMFAGFADGTPATCATSCHSAGTSWRYKWSATVTSTTGAQCDNCHGMYPSYNGGVGWNVGVGHAENPTRGNTSTHDDVGNLSFPCTACHVIGATTNEYPFATTTNDWADTDPGATTLHGDGQIVINDLGGHLRYESPVGTWESGCQSCHDGPSNDGVNDDATQTGNGPGNHDFQIALSAPSSPRFSLTPNITGDDPAPGGGGCDACHGSGGYFAPNATRGDIYPDRPGKHAAHVAALQAKGVGQIDACTYCHPYPTGETSYATSGNVHNTVAAPADVPNPAAGTPTYFKRIIGGANDDDTGTEGKVTGSGTLYVTCNTVDCHFNNAVTPHWYTDDVPPAPVLAPNIVAATGTEPNSIKVTWVSPGDDDNTPNTTPYKYEMRYGTDTSTAQTYSYTPAFAGDPMNYVGGMPMAYKQGSPQEVTVRDLTPGQTYYFTMKTWDVAGNVSTISDMVSAVASGDSADPDFGGVNWAAAGDESATINVEWTPAEDHTMPITYKLWIIAEGTGSGPNNSLDMDLDTPLLTGLTDHSYQLTSTDGLANNTTYFIGVRACDSASPTPNCDDNKQVVSATTKELPVVAKTYSTYVSNNAAAPVLTKGGSYGGTASTLAVLTTKDFIASAAYTSNTMVYADTFSVYLENGDRRNPYNVSVTLGYSTNGTTWAGTKGLSKTVSVGGGAKRVVSFKLADFVNGKQFNTDEYLVIRLQDVATSGKISTSYGTSATRGDLTVAERLVNTLPSNPNLLAPKSGAMVNMTWTPSTDIVDGVNDTANLHYDIYGSFNGGPYNHLIASGLPVATNNYTWNTQESGFTSGTVAVRIAAGDGYGHQLSTVTGIAIDNSGDNVAPGQIKDLTASKRPKDGTVMLKWCAPGDDEGNHGRAVYYDIRYSTSQITELNWDSATQVFGEPTPDFGGETQTYEVTGLTSGVNYYFGIKTVDEGGKVSALSTVKTVGDEQQVGGPRCGMCHTTGPSVVESVGNHKLHGITLHDCAHCHGTEVESYGLDHQDGILTMGYGDGGPQQAIISGNRIYYTNNGLPMGSGGDYVLYDDPDGGYGFNDPNAPYVAIGDNFDDGSCFNFKTRSVGGCHGPAGSDPDGTANGYSGAPYVSPTWDAAATQDCANCHGAPGRTTDTFYARQFDATTAAWEADNETNPIDTYVPDQIKGTPPIDNHGYSYADAGIGESARKYIGQHEKHLNYSFRFSKGDSCNLCHAGKYALRNGLDGKHANGEIDVKLDAVVAGANASWISGTATTAGSCSDLDANFCHPKDVLAGGTAPTPKWDSGQSFDCIECHGMDGNVPNHTTDPAGSGFVDDSLGNCEWCHFGGHPRSDLGGTSLILSNSAQVGINYRSGGIHIKKSIGGRASFDTEAELCWGCHDSQSTKISEWVNDEGDNNHASTKSANAFDTNYNYGQVNAGASASWYANKTPGSETGANWVSPNFAYKNGPIKSTHSTSYSGTSAITGSFRARSEALDAVANIRCSNCHDVHNLNKAPGDTMTGKPYLRGTWIRNPYREDGAPLSTSSYASANRFNTVPRGGNQHAEYGGFQIDQNNSNPTAGLSLPQSAGLCTLCHGTDVDTMDRYVTGTSGPKTDSENYWVGTAGNGHSNGVIGGTGLNKSDIFNYAQRNPTTAPVTYTGSYSHGGNPNMGYQNALDLATNTRAGGFRSQYSGGSYGYNVQPLITADYAYNDFNWGLTQDTGTVDEGYHNFTCSKCHNPHASRLPKLMITNCLDTSKNTWDNSRTVPASGGQNTASADNANKTLSQATSAQNCHRLGDPAQTGTGAGWNTVTPW